MARADDPVILLSSDNKQACTLPFSAKGTAVWVHPGGPALTRAASGLHTCGGGALQRADAGVRGGRADDGPHAGTCLIPLLPLVCPCSPGPPSAARFCACQASDRPSPLSSPAPPQAIPGLVCPKMPVAILMHAPRRMACPALSHPNRGPAASWASATARPSLSPRPAPGACAASSRTGLRAGGRSRGRGHPRR